MTIGIPKEVSIEEKRISLTPQGVYTLVKEGHQVFIEKGAGTDGHFSDDDFQSFGGQIVYSHEEAFKRADLVVKVLPSTGDECHLFRSNQTIFSFLQLGLRTPQCMLKLLENKVTSIGTEIIETMGGHHPVLEAMSEIAGSMMPQIAGHYLECTHGGRGITLSGIPGIPPATIVILGSGTLGTQAAEAFLGLGAQVHILDKDLQKLRLIYKQFGKRVFTSVSNTFTIERALRFADVVIGSVFEYGKKPPVLITKELLQQMKPGSIIIDAAIDQGGCLETSRPTTHSNPVFLEQGIIHYCVPNIPAAVARTASQVLNDLVLPYILRIGKLGIKKVLDSEAELQKGLISYAGKCVNQNISEIFNLPYKKYKN